MEPDSRHVIITGGSSGIGAAIANAYARKGGNVSLIARREAALVAKIRELETGFGQGGQRFQFQVADVRKAHAISQAIERCVAELGPCDILVACAGIVDPAPFDRQPAERFDDQIATNLIGAVNSIRPVFGPMMERKSGKILIVGSGAGLVGIFGYSAYCASKAGLTGFAEALRQEGLPHGVRVSICHPPDTETPQLSAERSLRPVEAQAIIGTAPAWSAAAVAKAAINGLERNRAAIYPGLPMKFLGYSGFLAPLLRSWFDRKIARTGRPASDR